MCSTAALPASDVAALLDTGVAAVNSGLQRARATLRDHLPRGTPRGLDVARGQRDGAHLLERLIDAQEPGDTHAALALIADDVRITMPPHPYLYEGREAIMPLLRNVEDREANGDWRLVPIRANRQPAAASYLRRPGDTVFRAFKIDVLRVRDGRIAEFTTFDATLFDPFGLAPTL